MRTPWVRQKQSNQPVLANFYLSSSFSTLKHPGSMESCIRQWNIWVKLVTNRSWLKVRFAMMQHICVAQFPSPLIILYDHAQVTFSVDLCFHFFIPGWGESESPHLTRDRDHRCKCLETQTSFSAWKDSERNRWSCRGCKAFQYRGAQNTQCRLHI